MFDKYSEPTLNVVLRDMEDGGYFFITKIDHFNNRDIALVELRGSDPLMTYVKRFKIDTRDLVSFYDKIKDRVSFNFNIERGELYIPSDINVDRYNYESTSNYCEGYGISKYTVKTPVEILWELVCGGYSFIWDGCGCTPCNMMYFGQDNFSIKVKNMTTDEEIDIMKYVNSRYIYSKMLVVADDDVPELISPDTLFGGVTYIQVKDDFGRQRKAFVLDLKKYESKIYDVDKYDRIYSKSYTLTVIDTMYCLASYLNGLSMILSDMGVKCNRLVIPCKSSDSFMMDLNKQHDTFTIQNIGYSNEVEEFVRKIYIEHKDDLTAYLRTKNTSLRDRIYNIFMKDCQNKFCHMVHYFVNGVLDALAIQKGDKSSRIQILTGYIDTVNKEFLMYGLYFYDLRTMFIRNNYRIEREFKDTLVVNNYNGSYFRVG